MSPPHEYSDMIDDTEDVFDYFGDDDDGDDTDANVSSMP